MSTEELVGLVAQRPQNFCWLLGAGASRSCGLPTASDLLWDMRRRHYNKSEGKSISHQDIQSTAVRERIESYMQSQGFPREFTDGEYSEYFLRIFGNDKERQRRYLRAILSEEKVKLTSGLRALGAMIVEGCAPVVFTTNFDTVVEKAVATVSGSSLTAYHLERGDSALNALNNGEHPIYCKLHGDFRYDHIKNLDVELKSQDVELSRCLLAASSRYGLIVSGYSGRDASILKLLHQVLEHPNPYPNGLFWTGLRGTNPPQTVNELLAAARGKGVDARWVEIETFDSLMLRIWNALDIKSAEVDRRVQGAGVPEVCIPLSAPGKGQPLLRMNALPIHALPRSCLELRFDRMPEWPALKSAQYDSGHAFVAARSDVVLAWGSTDAIKRGFALSEEQIAQRDLPDSPDLTRDTVLKGLLEEVLVMALAKNRSLHVHSRHRQWFLVASSSPEAASVLLPIQTATGAVSGSVPRLRFEVETNDWLEKIPVTWAECVQVSLTSLDGRYYILLQPDIWIAPAKARRDAADFLEARRKDRRNDKHDEILSAWIAILAEGREENGEVRASPFSGDAGVENPVFTFSRRTAYAKRGAS